tara:strand:- start:166 stop:405 length:240 start_codon:yes stop_codon:yes gene_type:complete
MNALLEIIQLANGDIVLRDSEGEDEPLVKISFSDDVKDMLGPNLLGMAGAMLDAATEHIAEGRDGAVELDEDAVIPVVH